MSCLCLFFLKNEEREKNKIDKMCTGILLQLPDGTFVVGRTMELGVAEQWYQISHIPKGRHANFKYSQFKYPVVGVAFRFQPLWIMDGYNSEGLYCGAFMFPRFASYGWKDDDKKLKPIPAEEVASYLLGTASSLDQVRATASKLSVAFSFLHVPLHWWVVDSRTGKSLVLEPLQNGQLSVFENTLGICTNSPPFPWHFWNTYNYFGNQTFSKGMSETFAIHAIPGSFSSPDRFIRAWLLRNQIQKNTTPGKRQEVIQATFHLLHQFDIPKGVSCETQQCEKTDWSLVSDPVRGQSYFTTYQDPRIQMVRL
jgi:choloylglycine hydrolase